MTRVYENLFIVKPDATEEEIDHLVDQMSKSVTTTGGTIDKVDKWGKRRLAYRVEKHREGSYVLMQFTADATTVKEFERRLRVQDSVIKFLTVRIDETLKRLEKRKKEREKRAHRRPQAAAIKPRRLERSNISGARRFAGFASKRSTISTTKTFACCRHLSPSAVRLCLAASRAYARRISAV
jgi:small subunit ribosomal protein S6